MCVDSSQTVLEHHRSMLAAAVFVRGHKVRHHRLLYDDFLDFDSRISPKRLRSGDMAVLACLYDRGRLLSIENTSAVLDTTRTDIVREVLATATDYIYNRTTFIYFRTSLCE